MPMVMRLKYFPDTDSAHIELTGNDVYETWEISEHFLIDRDRNGNVVSLTIEHAKSSASRWEFSYQEMPGRIA